jgi:hypothetical protein
VRCVIVTCDCVFKNKHDCLLKSYHLVILNLRVNWPKLVVKYRWNLKQACSLRCDLSYTSKIIYSIAPLKFLTFSCHKNEHKKFDFTKFYNFFSNIRKNIKLFLVCSDWKKAGKKVKYSNQQNFD